jgi:hypothetical protein
MNDKIPSGYPKDEDYLDYLEEDFGHDGGPDLYPLWHYLALAAVVVAAGAFMAFLIGRLYG